jgi:cell division protein FtsN
MKLKTTLLAAILAAFAATTVFAADDAMTKKADTPTAEKAKAKKPVKKHNHMEEKTGIKASESATPPQKRDPAKIHDHTKERQ